MAEDAFTTETHRKIRTFAQQIKAIDQQTLDDFIMHLKIKNNQVCGFKYLNIKPKLTEEQWLALLKIVDFNPAKIRDWDSQECGPPCQPNLGHACDPVRCH